MTDLLMEIGLACSTHGNDCGTGVIRMGIGNGPHFVCAGRRACVAAIHGPALPT